MGTLSFCYPIVFFLCLLLGLLLYRREPSWGVLDRLWTASLPLLIFVIGARLFNEVLLAPTQIWDTVNLLPAYLLADGKPLYYPPGQGPILDMMYGPMTAVAYWPVTWFTRHPTYATSLAKLCTVFYFFLPAALIGIIRPKPSLRAAIAIAGAFVAYVYYVLQSSSLSGSALWNHADAPALGWAGLSCAILYWRLERKNVAWLYVSAFLAVLSMWTKQVTVPLVVAMALYLMIADGFLMALQYTLGVLVFGAMTTLVFSSCYGFSELWFNLVVNPSLQPWNKDLVKTEGWAVVELMERMRWMGILLSFFLIYEFHHHRFKGSMRAWFDRERWILFIVASLCLIPSALAGRMRVGGDLNAISFSTFFLVTGMYALILRYVTSPEPSEEFHFSQLFLKKFLFAYAVTSMVIQLPVQSYYFVCLPKYLHRLESNTPKVAYTYAKAHPGELYMPWNGLETYLAEGKIYHFEYAVFDREVGNLPPSEEHFRAGLPTAMQAIAYPPNEQARHVMKHFPEYVHETIDPELPGWTIYETGARTSQQRHTPDPQRPIRLPKGRLL